MKTLLLDTSKKSLELAGKILSNGGLVAFPTETVYGLGANALSEEAVKKIYEAKGRPSDNPMIVHIAKKSDLTLLTDEVTKDMITLMETFWPGALTMIVKSKESVPLVTRGGLSSVGVRLPEDEVAKEIIELSKVPIAAPSANLSGKPSPTKSKYVVEDMDGKIDAIVQGEDCKIGIESTVIDMTSEIPMILRPGIITKSEIEKTLGKTILIDPYINSTGEKSEMPLGNLDKDIKDIKDSETPLKETFDKSDRLDKDEIEVVKNLEESFSDESLVLNKVFSEIQNKEKVLSPKSPGMKYKHYAPKAEMIIFRGEKSKVEKVMQSEVKKYEKQNKSAIILPLYEMELKEIAMKFFDMLREADNNEIDIILAPFLEEDGVGFSIMNRMLRSAGFKVIDV